MNMSLNKQLLALAVALALTACAKPQIYPHAAPTPSNLPAAEAVAKAGEGSYSEIYKYTDESAGVTCYAMNAYHGPAISCVKTN